MTKSKTPRKSNAGRKPLPTNLHILNGNPSKLDLEERAAAEPKYTPVVPECPEWLSDDAKAEWNRLLPELDRNGLLTKADMAAFAGYCDSFSMWKQANEILAREGLTVQTAEGGIKPHPVAGIRDRALEKVKSFSVEFGFTPSSRSRVNLPDTTGEDDEMERLLNDCLKWK